MKHLTLIGLTALLTACGGGDDGTPSQPTQPAKMSLAFSDAPVDSVSKVCIAVSNISIHPVSGTEQSWTTTSFLSTDLDDGCTPVGQMIPLDDAGHPLFTYIDLLAHQGADSRPLLGLQDVTPGEYSQMRLQILDGTDPDNQLPDDDDPLTPLIPPTPYSYVLQDDGVIKPLEVPSSELKLHSFTIAANGTTAFNTEFDLRHSMVLPGHEEHYKLKPNGVRLVNTAEVATVSGTVATGLCTDAQLNEGLAFVYFYLPGNYESYPDMDLTDNGFYASAPVMKTDTTYSYELGFVNPGSYDVVLMCNGSADNPEEPGDPIFIAPVSVPETDLVKTTQSVVAPTTTINFTLNPL